MSHCMNKFSGFHYSTLDFQYQYKTWNHSVHQIFHEFPVNLNIWVFHYLERLPTYFHLVLKKLWSSVLHTICLTLFCHPCAYNHNSIPFTVFPFTSHKKIYSSYSIIFFLFLSPVTLVVWSNIEVPGFPFCFFNCLANIFHTFLASKIIHLHLLHHTERSTFYLITFYPSYWFPALLKV